MVHRKIAPVLALSFGALACSLPVFANPEIDRLRAEFEQKLKALQETYDARIQELETRLIAKTVAAAAEPAVLPSAPARSSAAGNFNPEISLVLQGAYAKRGVEERQLAGFAAAGHDHGSERGFRLDHTELVFSANIDPYFRGHANFALADGEIAVEEAWFQTLGLRRGLTLKGGRFLSGLGYANEQHPHAWDFADPSLMYRALFGERLTQDGVQLRWLAPTATYLEFGAEAARGQFFPGSDAAGDKNGMSTWAAFVKAGGDLGDSHSWRAGLNYLAANPRARAARFEDANGVPAATAFGGSSRTWSADFVWKWAPEGNARETNFKLQAEYFRRREIGEMFCADNSAQGGACTGLSDRYRATQSGWYAQGVWQFLAGWRVGYRHDRLDPGSVSFGENPLGYSSFHPTRHSLMLDYSPSEFSRFRLQAARDRSMAGLSDQQITLQYIHSLGAHGAHQF